MRRREVLAAISGAVVYSLPAVAQHSTAKTYLILWVSTEAQPDPFIAGFREGLREHGYIEGQNIAFVLRYAPDDPSALRAMLPDILRTPADLIVSSGPAIQAMRAATGRTVLFAISGDPVELGIAESLARPGRNFTGRTFMSLDVAQKRVELLKELLPELRTLAVLSNTNHPGERSEHDATRSAAKALSIRTAYVPFSSAQELEGALGQVRTSGADAVLVFPEGVTMVHRGRIAAFAQANRMPSMFGWREYCDAGGFASYGANQRATYMHLAAYADRLLRGEKPESLPIQQASTFELVFNLKTARNLGLQVPAALLARADDLIE
jgi:putative ABC transport system substrate-binding protein